MTPSEHRELIELWLLAGEGAADESQLARLNHWIESEAEARSSILTVARQQGWLAWNAGDVPLPAALTALATDAAATSAASAAADLPAKPSAARWAWAAIAASVLSFLAGQWYADQPSSAAKEGQPVQATMVSSTGCVWGPANTTNLLAGAGLAGGDTVQLLEGIAEFRIGLGGSDVRLQMEGPASVVLTAQGSASISYGKIVVKTGSLDAASYAVETSYGRVLIKPHSETGLVSFGSAA
jgi:hypothetical protein